MDTFRHPSLARLFYIFFGCLLAAFMFQKMLLSEISLFKIKIAWYLLLLMFIGLFIVGLSGNHTITRAFHTIISEGVNTAKIKSVLDEFTFSDVLLINLTIELPFVIASYFFLIKKLKLRWLLIAGLTNCFIHTALYQPFSVVSTYTVSFMEKNIDTLKVQGFPPPNVNASVLSNSEYSPHYINFFGPIDSVFPSWFLV